MDELSRERLALAQEWFQKADEDINVAERLICDEGFAISICFHVQQCIEKYLKGFLTYHGIEFQRTHELEVILLECVQVDGLFRQWLTSIIGMTEYAVAVRYPGGRNPSEQEARIAVATARRVRDFVLERLAQQSSR